ncbi:MULTISPECIES: SLATT domain-containing protein [Thermomonospora]|uniref:SMODS and SLOG-associating 2TM effector domain-containing protein n=1 Tax=Thermomonospora curvata (strain ATCC 19995 / DSM 43183 / JCM 3096 / KCTC 9072 / NBRC 15933 / NCIMB 10081 / Henssen B9) TaxID=471852 RepID=D1A9K9_THECD|nr:MULTISPECIES: SLATT domain-containing protein [Thermomonospora]ACY98695.1 hypothetical protein Tcur_3154 [Thermomonospora curvata DSM 43183]
MSTAAAGQPPVPQPALAEETGRGRQSDLRAWRFRLPEAQEWQRPEEVLRRLYEEAEARAVEAYGWYMRDRVRRRTLSRVLRALAVALGSAGGVVPLASVVGGGGRPSGWGYVLLALAGACYGFDHFLGISSGWMRDMRTAQKIQRRLQEFQFDWAARSAEEARSGQSEVDVAWYLNLLRGFVLDLSEIMMDETAEWIAEFQSGLLQLQTQVNRR